MAMILGMKVSVISCTWVSAWSSAMTMPIAIAAATAAPEATMTVHRADWTMSSASAWFMSRHRHAGAQQHLPPVLEDGDGAARDHADARHRPGDGAVVGGDGTADQALGLRHGHGRHQRIELVVGLDGLLDAGERGELGHELRRV